MFIKIKPVIKAFVPVIVAIFAVGAIVFAWTEPSQPPPDGNVDAPLNAGAIGQSKRGNLALNTDGELAYGLLVPFGNVGIGTAGPGAKLEVVGNTILSAAQIGSATFNSFVPPATGVVDNAGNTGKYTSIAAFSSTDYKVVYYSVTDGAFKAVQCTSADCYTHSTPVTIEASEAPISAYARPIAVDVISSTDWKIVYAYKSGSTYRLKAVQCTNADCSTRSGPNVISTRTNPVNFIKMDAVSASDWKIFFKESDGGLSAVQCTNISCSTNAGVMGMGSGDGTADIGLTAVSSTDWKLVTAGLDGRTLYTIQCTNASCSTSSTWQSMGYIATYTVYSIDTKSISSTDWKIIFPDGANLRAVQCTGAAVCGGTLYAIATEGSQILFTSLSLISSTDWKISYFVSTTGALKAMQCTNATCSTRSTPVTIDDGTAIGKWTSVVAISSTDWKISYYDDDSDDLKVVQCKNADCSSHSLGGGTPGNVGIGTDSPAEKLHVVGDTKVDGKVIIGGGEIYWDGTKLIIQVP